MTGAWADNDGRIAIDIPCARCGYNLRSLSAGGLCPECGSPVRDSEPLHLRSPKWLSRVRLGVLILLLSLPLTVAAPAAYDGVVFLIFGPGTSVWPRQVGERVEHNPPFPWTGRIGLLVRGAPYAGALVAVLLITKREENDSTMAKLRSRSTARILALGGLLWLVGVTAIKMPHWHGLWWKLSVLPETLLDLLYPAIALATLSYVTYLLGRGPRPKLARFSRLLLWLLLPLAAAWVALSAAGLTMCLLWSEPPEPPYAWPVSAPATTPTTTSSTPAPTTSATTQYIITDESLAMTLTTTAPAFMLERWQEFEQAEQQCRQRVFFWVDVYRAIRAYAIIPGALWGCCVLALLALLWWTLHRAIQQNAKLDRPPA